ncbi:MAG: RDD family protein [Actinomycetota bacterium]|nr:RDD family protein [Actinomycetota bacterium]
MADYPFPKASIQHRLGQYLLDIGLALVTLGIGYIIWFCIILGQGQTPAKQVLKLRVYDATTGTPAKWGHMFIREVGLYFALGIATLVPALLLYPDSFLTIFDLVSYVVILVDAFWIFKGGKRQRLVDVICKTDVLNEAAK